MSRSSGPFQYKRDRPPAAISPLSIYLTTTTKPPPPTLDVPHTPPKMHRSTAATNLLVALLFFFALLANAAPIEKRASYSGDATFYEVGLGSCGETNSDDELVAALSSELMGSGEYCGKSAKIKSKSGSVTVKVVDTCPSCAKGSVDLSPAAFKKIGDLSEGRISITWSI